MRPLVLTPTDCNWPAGKPSCWIWLTWTLPLASANWVTPPVPKLTTGLPIETPLTTQLVSVMEAIAGDIWPLAAKVKLVLTFCQATCVPEALGLTW